MYFNASCNFKNFKQEISRFQKCQENTYLLTNIPKFYTKMNICENGFAYSVSMWFLISLLQWARILA